MAASSCQQNIQILSRDLSSLFIKALGSKYHWLRFPWTGTLIRVHSYLLIGIRIAWVWFVPTEMPHQYSMPRALAVHSLRISAGPNTVWEANYVLLLPLFSFFGEEIEDERALPEVSYIVQPWKNSSNEEWVRGKLGDRAFLDKSWWFWGSALLYVQWGVWTRSGIGKQGGASHMLLPNVRFCWIFFWILNFIGL